VPGCSQWAAQLRGFQRSFTSLPLGLQQVPTSPVQAPCSSNDFLRQALKVEERAAQGSSYLKELVSVERPAMELMNKTNRTSGPEKKKEEDGRTCKPWQLLSQDFCDPGAPIRFVSSRALGTSKGFAHVNAKATVNKVCQAVHGRKPRDGHQVKFGGRMTFVGMVSSAVNQMLPDAKPGLLSTDLVRCQHGGQVKSEAIFTPSWRTCL
ncbi:unnamed protein product, partial [Cladocopium goreaui]